MEQHPLQAKLPLYATKQRTQQTGGVAEVEVQLAALQRFPRPRHLRLAALPAAELQVLRPVLESRLDIAVPN